MNILLESRRVTLKERKRKRLLPAKVKNAEDTRAISKVNGKVKRHSRTAIYNMFKAETDELISKICGPEFLEICKLQKRRACREWAIANPERKREQARIQQARLRLMRKNRFGKHSRGKYPREGSRLSRKVYYWKVRDELLAKAKEKRLKKKEDNISLFFQNLEDAR